MDTTQMDALLILLTTIALLLFTCLVRDVVRYERWLRQRRRREIRS